MTQWQMHQQQHSSTSQFDLTHDAVTTLNTNFAVE